MLIMYYGHLRSDISGFASSNPTTIWHYLKLHPDELDELISEARDYRQYMAYKDALS